MLGLFCIELKYNFSFWKYLLNYCNLYLLFLISMKLHILYKSWRFPKSISHRSNHQRCSINKGVLRNFAKFTGKRLCQSLFFNKVVGLRSANLLKKRLRYRCFPEFWMEFCEIFKNTFNDVTPLVAASMV